MESSLVDVSTSLFGGPGDRSKSHHCYNIYEEYFGPIRNERVGMFEVGVYNGESTKIFSKYFENGLIVGIDHVLKEIDLSGYDNIKLFQGDQSDPELLSSLSCEYFPDGIDIVLDDASHIGSLSRRTFDILFPYVKAGGIYIIEDWGTGYWTDWPDGGLYETHETRAFHEDQFPKRLPSHDFGMVGFVKQVTDLVGMSDNRPTFGAQQKVQSQIRSMHIYPGTVVLQKI